MKVTFAHYGEDIASSRLRARIPQEELAKLGIQKGRDVLIYGKHVLSLGQVRQFGKRVFDICDDHFDNDLRGYYITHAREANQITCNSEVMRSRIKHETGRDSIVIKEPYESPEFPPTFGPKLLWFGHRSNLDDLDRISPRLRYPILALSNHPDLPKWTPDRFLSAVKSDCIVIIPTGKSQAKSENRMVEAIRCGKYVCAEFLPAYEPFEQFYPCGDIPKHIEAAISDPGDSMKRIAAAQDYIRDKYSPEAIGKQWLEVINGIS